ncbi:hypothetical protein [Albatrosspox virus]|nr:hypothetical protein [Penguinpox virus 2]QRM16173.1 hypothetical protein [Albatrosspox virus]
MYICFDITYLYLYILSFITYITYLYLYILSFITYITYITYKSYKYGYYNVL